MPGYQGGYQTCPACKGRIYVEWGCLAECSCGFAEGARCDKCHNEYDPELAHCPDCGPKPQFYECGICTQYHSAAWNGDCREDNARFNPEDLDKKYGIDGWEEVPMPGGEEDYESQTQST